MAYYLFRIAGFIGPILPTRLGYWLFARFGDLAFVFAAKRYATYFHNLRRVLGPTASAAELNAVARRGFQNNLKNYFDLFRAHQLTPSQLRAQLAGVEGLDHLRDAIRQGNGVVAGSAHFGNWDMVMQLCPVYLDTKVVVPNERLKPEKLFQYILALRRSQGIQVVPLENVRALIQAIRDGYVVGLAYDRDITQSGQVVNFFGAPARLPDGAVQLALKYDIPAIIGFSIRQDDNRNYVYIEPPLQFVKTDDSENDLHAGVEKIAAVMEKYIRQYPDQWLMFQQVWEQ